MRCPNCGYSDTWVTNTYSFDNPTGAEKDVIVRARKCGLCHEYFMTIESNNQTDLTLSDVRELYKEQQAKKKED